MKVSLRFAFLIFSYLSREEKFPGSPLLFIFHLAFVECIRQPMQTDQPSACSIMSTLESKWVTVAPGKLEGLIIIGLLPGLKLFSLLFSMLFVVNDWLSHPGTKPPNVISNYPMKMWLSLYITLSPILHAWWHGNTALYSRMSECTTCVHVPHNYNCKQYCNPSRISNYYF